MPGEEDNDGERRRNEINMFAAMALGGGVDDGGMDDNDINNNTAFGNHRSGGGDGDGSAFDGGSFIIPSKDDKPKNTTELQQTDERALFSQQANAGVFGGDFNETGTFAMTSASSSSSSNNNITKNQFNRGNVSEQSNLEAAAAALAVGEDDDYDDDGEAGGFGAGGSYVHSLPAHMMPPISEAPTFHKMEEEYPMYAEEVHMPRPLFFGPVIPPRVLNEARQIVKEALFEKGYTGVEVLASGEFKVNEDSEEKTQSLPRLNSLPPEVRNIVGALRVYGFGLSAFPFDGQRKKQEEAEPQRPFWKGTSYVSTFQPVFGDTARMYRHKKRKLASAPHPSHAKSDSIPGNSSSTGVSTQEKESKNKSESVSSTANPQDNTLAATDLQENSALAADAEAPAPISEKDLFSMWARGEAAENAVDNNSLGASGGGGVGNDSFGSINMDKSVKSNSVAAAEPVPMSDQDLFSQWARGESPANGNSNGTFAQTSFQDSFIKPDTTGSQKPFSIANAAGTFQRVPSANLATENDSDDDSIVGSELKKKVGINEHLDAALASLVDDGPISLEVGEDYNARTMLQVTRATPGGRPLSNLELSNGCIPLYGVDDTPLPVEGDLGIHETKDEQQRTFEQNRSQEIIEKFVGPNVFGPVACPNPAAGPDDNHSWNSRAAPSQRYINDIGGGAHGGGNIPDRVTVGVSGAVDANRSPRPPSGPPRKSTRHQSPKKTASVTGPPPNPTPPNRTSSEAAAAAAGPIVTRKSTKSTTGSISSGGAPKQRSRFGSRHRYGWWSIPEEVEPGKGGMNDVSTSRLLETSQSGGIIHTDRSGDDPLQLPPIYHPANNVHIDTGLHPTPEELREENLPLSSLHAATSMAHALPYLSDRPPSYRYLQIDTQAVGFPPLGGEVEPLFCSLAIYNVETVSGGMNDSNAAPMPDLQRCGRVTEVLTFDVVSDQQVEDNCVGSLWPFFASSTMTPPSSRSSDEDPSPEATTSKPSNVQLQGTRCGVFPLPSNLNVANLYAVLLVHKVLSEDADFEIYLKHSKKARSAGPIDVNKFRARAEKASNQHGSFLMPFAFGVAPLLQVFGADNPVVAISRAVQIPLFRFSAGQGERQIIDHIMVMLYPRADFRANGIGGPAAVTNGGTAMLVMRNFGYLGLHAVVHSRSSLARDRLVDFTGELQVRRRNEVDPPVNNELVAKKEDDVYDVPEWHSQFISEPTIYGGRNLVQPLGTSATSKPEGGDENPSRSPLYAQELAPVPLAPVPSNPSSRPGMSHKGVASRSRAQAGRGDIEPYYHASFCNELLCHPRLLHNCPKGNIVMKVELREMEWKQEHNAFIAHLPKQGPSIHNTRRGPFLIQGTYTSCAVRSSDPHFLDEVKVKLPLKLKSRNSARTLSLFFTVYHVKFSSKKKWKVLPKINKRDQMVSGVNSVNEATGERSQQAEESELSGKCKLVLLSCGFLPMTSQGCLIDNGLHDVKMMYEARPPNAELRNSGTIPASSLIVVEKGESGVSLKDSLASSGFEPREDDTYNSSRTYSEAEILGADDSDLSPFSSSEPSGGEHNRLRNEAITTDALSKVEASQKLKGVHEEMALQVRIVVHSSLHAQNATISNFLHHEADQPLPSTRDDGQVMSILTLSRDEISQKFSTGQLGCPPVPEEEKLISSIVSLAKPQQCPTPDISKHFLRVILKLWKTVVCGSGATDLSWANPASLVALRVHSFGSLLQLLGSVSAFMSKNGVTQLDGTGKWDQITLGRIVALLCDEENLFGSQKEIVGDTDLYAKPSEKSKNINETSEALQENSYQVDVSQEKPKTRRRHQRNNSELFNHSVDALDKTSNFGDLLSNDDFRKRSQTIAAPPSQKITQDTSAVGTSTSMSTETGTDNEISKTGSTSSGVEEVRVSDLDLSNLYQPNSLNPDVKLDSVSDFRSNLEIGRQSETSEDGFDSPLTASNVDSLMQKFGGLSGAGKKRWMTAPAPGLATIRESEEGDGSESGMTAEDLGSLAIKPGPSGGPKDELDSEIHFQTKKSSVKQMRVPKTRGKTPTIKEETDTAPDFTSGSNKDAAPNPLEDTLDSIFDPKTPDIPASPIGVPRTDEEIEKAGGEFLASIGQSLSLGVSSGEKQRIGSSFHRKTDSYHRKTRSRCSIDWNLIGDEPEHPFERKASNEQADSFESEFDDECDEHDEAMPTLRLEDENCIQFPNYVDRLAALGKVDKDRGRWFPYTYEVVIMLWTAFLVQQRSSGVSSNSIDASGSGTNKEADSPLAQAASGAHRVTVASAPLLFEVIKQSLGHRMKMLSREFRRGDKDKTDKKSKCPPLAVLDDALQSTLEQLISVITDACIDSRNFDSRDVRQMSIDVNDTIIRFLRDMFGFLRPSSAYRLVLVYLSRFVNKEGRQYQDRDSSIGLRCSWEITKLRLNAVTALIRFPDFLRVCSPQMNNWGDWWTKDSQHHAPDKFFDDVLERYKRLEMSEFVTDGAFQGSELKIPSIRPHWLTEIVTDICLQGTEHAEQYIQQRAASLLHELFWASSQQSMVNGTSPVVGSMYITFLERVLLRTSYLSNFAPKSQLRKDILPCILFILQTAPSGLLRAQWRKLCWKTCGKGSLDRYGGVSGSLFSNGEAASSQEQSKNPFYLKNEPDILDMFTLLNMSLSTIEYEGCEDLLENDGGCENDDQIVVWHKEYLLSLGKENQQPFMKKRQPSSQGKRLSNGSTSKRDKEDRGYLSTGSRKWQAHDGSMVIINSGHQIVTELYALLDSSSVGQSQLNPARPNPVRRNSSVATPKAEALFGKDVSSSRSEFKFSRPDTVVFVRAATSLYLHSLALRASDIILVRTFKVSADLVKIFGIKVFLEACGETLQHWLRVVSMHCGARRAQVRIEATDFLELILRTTWESFGSFFRIRVPLLAVQTEVMERIVAIAAARYYREERRQSATLDNFSNASAEASLAPLWRTLDRLHHQPASQNVAFRGALIRLAEKLKKLYRAYIAARALSYLKGVKSPKNSNQEGETDRKLNSSDSDALVRAYRICVLRVINASAGYSKQFLGFHGTSLSNSSVAHYEAVEDAFLDAADVFSPTELPEHRVAWLQMLTDFHQSRKKYAEEATCHFQIHVTLKQAARLHGSLWSNTPFLPWTSSPIEPIHIGGDTPSGNPIDYSSDFDFDEAEAPYGRQVDDVNSSRRIFYRVANSVRANTEDWETGLCKTLFCGVTFAAEYCSVSSWITLREMEEKMVEEAESAGVLFLEAGIIESCRFAWNLATQYYSEKFSYGKLANVYGCLARAVVSQVPPIDASQNQEVSISLGRFYRVWFHGGAPDELIGAEFVYRTASGVRLEQFGEALREVIKCIIPDRTPIHLVLDGKADESSQRGYGGFSRLGPAPLEPVRIKVTPLRPLFGKAGKIRGLPEWFHRYIDESMSRVSDRQPHKRRGKGHKTGGLSEGTGQMTSPGHRGNNLSFSSSASVFASSGSSASGSMFSRRSSLSKVGDGNRGQNGGPSSADTELAGVDKFGFLQPVHHKDRMRGNKDWWKPASGDFAQKSLKVTQLQVAQSFPACVTRQAVVHRVVFTLSPLEAGVDGVCQWCSVLFRTAVATNGQAVLGANADPGIGTDAAKVVADCIHSSRVKEMGLSLLKKNGSVAEDDLGGDIFQNSDRLMDEEVKKLQNKLARAVVAFLELLHLLIARNRDLLLNVIQDRRKDKTPAVLPPSSQGIVRAQTQSSVGTSNSNPRSLMRPSSYEGSEEERKGKGIVRSVTDDVAGRNVRLRDDRSVVDDQSHLTGGFLSGGAGNVRTDSAIAVQSELQRSFIALTKTLYPVLSGVLQSDTPRWLRQCCQENYFSLGTYRQTRIPISEELCFSAPGESVHPVGDRTGLGTLTNPLMSEYLVDRTVDSPGGSVASSSVFSRANSEGKRSKYEF